MKHAQNINGLVFSTEVGNSIMTIEKNPDLAFLLVSIFVADFRKFRKNLRSFKYS